MPRPPNIIRPVRLNTTIPEDLRGRLDLYLYSDAQQCIPYGAYQQFIVGLIRDFFERLDNGKSTGS